MHQQQSFEFLNFTRYSTMSFVGYCKKLFLSAMASIWDLIVIGALSVIYIGESIALTFTPTFLRSQKSLRNKIILLTGGAGGVGQELTLRLARLKAKVVVWDINEKALEKVQEKCAKEGYKIYTYAVDISDRQNVYKNADLVKSEVGHVDILINNAGIVCGNTFLDIPDHMIEKTYQVNILSHYWTTKAFLSDMLKNGRGHIVTMGSLTGLLGTYKCTDYSGTKHAAMGFHESLMAELKTHGHDNINMTIVCPYFINTGMFSGCKPRNFPMLEPKDVAKRLITAVRREEVYVTMPGWARFILPMKNFIPAKLAWALSYRLIKGPQSMMGLRPFQDSSSSTVEVAAA
ncbi:PREDICTED: short-chain dehydrogenase/reductase family 16C member 6 isoform X2 [Nicrophorus vespilloides]|uniref:Short-chain dehydrogenase/reductase family 16C member 6 isoform X2 n=1 Tax=Nicrophorus vespilloides TaxID=110193 RepID=A0ABM1M9M0_NICVS|nr:PREDICTED: short-chain dehydrogenase/reductase family 16C member 6 isoform X2 [Nicrophorus vespilloides]